jgi:5-methylcytosine-specific restriction endonuclease McrA
MHTDTSPARYCAYCGRVLHRCRCADADSPARQFFARSPARGYVPRTRKTPYKRGVPPQVKQRERAALRRQAADFYERLVAAYGAQCLNCGASAQATDAADAVKLVLDHIISVARGGKSTYDNMQLLCTDCNRIKGKLCIDCRHDRDTTT